MVQYLTGISKGRFAFGSFILCCGFLLLFYKDYTSTLNYTVLYTRSEPETEVTKTNFQSLASSIYLVNSSKCKIPDVDAFNAEASRFYHILDYFPCSKHKLLTYVTKEDNIATLHVDSDQLPSYTKGKTINCCHSNITRKKTKNKPDGGINISNCVNFTQHVNLSSHFVLVKCKDASGKTVYENVHATITITPSIRKRLENITQTNAEPLSVLFVGIDSISRLNLIRHLPKTHKFLEDNSWLPLFGYNKIGENTFPNLMGILAGYNESRAYSQCNPMVVGRLDRCNLVWYDYRRNGYVTAFNEDETLINTFNYGGKKGFSEPPTEYYFRPYMMASERLKKVTKGGMNYCTGPETAGERVLNSAKDFSRTFPNGPTFGFFWMNTFSHNELNAPSMMDGKVRDLLHDLKNYTRNTVVFFLSDHGIRFGDIRYTATGWLEERLPFIYVSLPEDFSRRFPREHANLQENSRKLTTPYDLHMTLQHLLQLSGFEHVTRPSDACPRCTSLFSEIPQDRSCEDAGIAPHWCTCGGYSSIDSKAKHVQEAAKYVVSQIQEIVARERKCAKYRAHKVMTASVSDRFTYKNDTYLLLVIETRPKAVFEATVSQENHTEFKLQGGIGRLDVYAQHSKCVKDANLKKYCYCR